MMKRFLPLCLLFLLFAVLLFLFRSPLREAGLNTSFVQGANAVLFVVTVLTFIISARSSHVSGHGTVTGVYASFLLKFFVIVVALFIYLSATENINKPAIFTSMGLYVLYTVTEVYQLMKTTRKHQ